MSGFRMGMMEQIGAATGNKEFFDLAVDNFSSNHKKRRDISESI
jgi:hypothetical protein